jgi:hypothetical protein
MLTHVLVSVGHTVGHLVCNGGAGYLRKVPALFKVKVKPFSSCTLYCLMLVCFDYWFTSTRYQHDSLYQLERMIRV